MRCLGALQFALAIALGVPSFCSAATIIVDPSGAGDFTEIQPAIDAAEDGDVVLVRPGEYGIREPIDFNRLHDPRNPESPPVKNITVRSEGGAGRTTIRMAEEPLDPDRASVVIFENGESEASVLEGFSLSGGKGTRRCGGGGACIRYNSSPRLRDLRIAGNVTSDRGGGVSCGGGFLDNCTILGNVARNGGGVYCWGGGSLDNCTIRLNWAERGGGLSVGGDTSTVTRCRILANTAAGTHPIAGYGGGVYSMGGSPRLEGCTIMGNWGERGGGGVFSGRSGLNLSSCLIVGNLAHYGGGVAWNASRGNRSRCAAQKFVVPAGGSPATAKVVPAG